MRFDRKQLLLYGVTDRSWLNGQTLYEQVRQALEGGVSFLQLREKNLSEQAFLEEAKEIQKLCREYKVPFIINDNVDLALEIDADGVHVGQDDMEAGEVRKDLERIRSSEFRHTRWRKRCALKNAGRLTLAPVLCLEAARKKMWER